MNNIQKNNNCPKIINIGVKIKNQYMKHKIIIIFKTLLLS